MDRTISKKSDIANKFLNAVLDFPDKDFQELEKYYPIVAAQRRIGASTLGELVAKDLQVDGNVGKMPSCPRCNSEATVKNGNNSSGTPRYECKVCGKTFSASADTLIYKVRQDTGKWMLLIQALLEGWNLKKTAVTCGISEPTVLSWRLRVFLALEELAKDVKLSGLIYADEKFIPYNLKGNHASTFAMPRNSHKRGHQNTIKNYQKNEIAVYVPNELMVSHNKGFLSAPLWFSIHRNKAK